MSFYNKVVIITGAGSGIGAATAVAFAKQSAKVSLVDINEQDLDNTIEVCKMYKANGLLKIVADLSSDEDVKRIVDDTIGKFGKLDVLVNCAGTYTPASIEDENLMKLFDRMIGVNLRSIVALTSYAVPALIESKGSIVNITSVAAKLTAKNLLPYGISKAGLMHFTKCVALELGDKGVRVNSISPGAVKTKIFQNSGLNDKEIKAFLDFCIHRTPLKAFIPTEEVAQLVLYLSSDNARSITGSDYVIDGGMRLNGLAGFE